MNLSNQCTLIPIDDLQKKNKNVQMYGILSFSEYKNLTGQELLKTSPTVSSKLYCQYS